LEPTLPARASSALITTARGPGDFVHDYWRRSEAGETRHTPVFVSALERADRSPAWLEQKRRQEGKWPSLRNYPLTAEDAFASAGEPYFAPELLAAAQQEGQPPSARRGDRPLEGLGHRPQGRERLRRPPSPRARGGGGLARGRLPPPGRSGLPRHPARDRGDALSVPRPACRRDQLGRHAPDPEPAPAQERADRAHDDDGIEAGDADRARDLAPAADAENRPQVRPAAGGTHRLPSAGRLADPGFGDGARVGGHARPPGSRLRRSPPRPALPRAERPDWSAAPFVVGRTEVWRSRRRAHPRPPRPGRGAWRRPPPLQSRG